MKFYIFIMPFVNIEFRKGNLSLHKGEIAAIVCDAINNTLKVPKEFIRTSIFELDAENFISQPNDFIIIKISMYAGRPLSLKKDLYQDIIIGLNSALEIDGNNVCILINEQPKENWGIRGGIPASELY